MASSADWSRGYARQAAADIDTYERLKVSPAPACHQLQFLQMACEKLVKAHLCMDGTDPVDLQRSHAYIRTTLPVVLLQEAVHLRFRQKQARGTLKHGKHLAQEIDLLAPSVDKTRRPDNCEYPWEDSSGSLRTPVDWRFPVIDLCNTPAGHSVLKLIFSAIRRLGA